MSEFNPLVVCTIAAFLIGFFAGFITGEAFKKISTDKTKSVGKKQGIENPMSPTKSEEISRNNNLKQPQDHASGVSQSDCKSKDMTMTVKEQKLSKKKQKKLERRQERALKQETEQKQHEEESLERERKAFNPKRSKPENVTYQGLAVSEGRLVPCALGQTSYYHYWEYEGRRFYEFYCEPFKFAKAVNNRSVILDPFCQKDSDSVCEDLSKSIKIIEFGELDKNLSIISKSIISYR